MYYTCLLSDVAHEAPVARSLVHSAEARVHGRLCPWHVGAVWNQVLLERPQETGVCRLLRVSNQCIEIINFVKTATVV